MQLATLLLPLLSTLATATPITSWPAAILSRRALSGSATSYGGNVNGGTCSFADYTLPAGLYGTALSSDNWDDAGNCGGCVEVSYQGKSLTAMIVDQCPSCGPNHLDLFQNAFTALAPLSLGVAQVQWDYVMCPGSVAGPLEIHVKEGSSQYWFSARVQNANRRTAKLEISPAGANAWTALPRQTYNYFEASSGTGGASSVDVRVTSHVGTVVVVQGVPAQGGAVKKAGANYT